MSSQLGEFESYPPAGAEFVSGADARAELVRVSARFGPTSGQWLIITGLTDEVPSSGGAAGARCKVHGCSFQLKFQSSIPITGPNKDKIVWEISTDFYAPRHIHAGVEILPRVQVAVEGADANGAEEAKAGSGARAKRKAPSTAGDKKPVVKQVKREWSREQFVEQVAAQGIDLSQDIVDGQEFSDLLTAENVILHQFHRTGQVARLVSDFSFNPNPSKNYPNGRTQMHTIGCECFDMNKKPRDEASKCPVKVSLKPVNYDARGGKWIIHSVNSWIHSHPEVEGARDTTWNPSHAVMAKVHRTVKGPRSGAPSASTGPSTPKAPKARNNQPQPSTDPSVPAETNDVLEQIESFVDRAPAPSSALKAAVPFVPPEESFASRINHQAAKQLAPVPPTPTPSRDEPVKGRENKLNPVAERMINNSLGRKKEAGPPSPAPLIAVPPPDAAESLNFLGKSARASTSLPEREKVVGKLVVARGEGRNALGDTIRGVIKLADTHSAARPKQNFEALRDDVDQCMAEPEQPSASRAAGPGPGKVKSAQQRIREKLTLDATELRPLGTPQTTIAPPQTATYPLVTDEAEPVTVPESLAASLPMQGKFEMEEWYENAPNVDSPQAVDYSAILFGHGDLNGDNEGTADPKLQQPVAERERENENGNCSLAPAPVEPSPTESPPEPRPSVGGKTLAYVHAQRRRKVQSDSGSSSFSETSDSDDESDDASSPHTSTHSPSGSPGYPVENRIIRPMPPSLVRPQQLREFLASIDSSLVPLTEVLLERAFWHAPTLDEFRYKWTAKEIEAGLVEFGGQELGKAQRDLLLNAVMETRLEVEKRKERAIAAGQGTLMEH